MKKVFYAALAVLAAASCSKTPEYQVTGRFEDMAGEDLCVMYLNKGYTRCDKADTLSLDENGAFAFNYPEKGVYGQVLITTFKEDGTATYDPYILFGTLPGEHVEITGTLADPTFKGSKFYQQLEEYKELTKAPTDSLYALRDSIQAKIAADPENSESYVEEYQTAAQAIMDRVSAMDTEFIKSHSSDDIAGYITGSMYDQDTFEEAYAIISDKVKKGVMGPFMENTRNTLKEMAARQAAMGHVEEGEEAPDFTLPTPDGSTLTLSSLRGKYVMLDFWGSWCKWCIKAIPDLKETYAKYSDKIEFVSIACNDKEDAWKKALEENQMPWKQVKNDEDNPVDAAYGVEAYPTFIFIDPEGKVVKKFEGHSEEFEAYFKVLFD